jgi:hypothetical protein
MRELTPAVLLEFWFFERFRGLTAMEIGAMLNLVTPIGVRERSGARRQFIIRGGSARPMIVSET